MTGARGGESSARVTGYRGGRVDQSRVQILAAPCGAKHRSDDAETSEPGRLGRRNSVTRPMSGQPEGSIVSCVKKQSHRAYVLAVCAELADQRMEVRSVRISPVTSA